jgi:anti-sigma factor RsiW
MSDVAPFDPGDDVLSAYADGELDDATRAEVDARLADSARWRALLDEILETRSLVRALPVHEAPPGFWDSVLQPNLTPLPYDKSAPVPLQRPNRRRRIVAAFAGAAAAAAAVLAVVVVPGESRHAPPVATLVRDHASRSSVDGDPVSGLATLATPVSLRGSR